jgi:hypothetical protein
MDKMDKDTGSVMLRWSVTGGGETYAVETRDHLGWVSDNSDATMVDGATAEVPRREARRPRITEVVAMKHWDDTPEVTHRRALDMLAMANGWTEVVDNEVRPAITATLQGTRSAP